MKFVELFEEKTLIGDREGKLLLLLPDNCQVPGGVSQHSATLIFLEHLFVENTEKVEYRSEKGQFTSMMKLPGLFATIVAVLVIFTFIVFN